MMKSNEIYIMRQERDKAKVELERAEKELDDKFRNDDHNNKNKIELQDHIAYIKNFIEEYDKELAVSKPKSEDAKESKKLIPDNSSKIEEYKRVISVHEREIKKLQNEIKENEGTIETYQQYISKWNKEVAQLTAEMKNPTSNGGRSRRRHKKRGRKANSYRRITRRHKKRGKKANSHRRKH
jgi:chromosome segregation ATPase